MGSRSFSKRAEPPSESWRSLDELLEALRSRRLKLRHHEAHAVAARAFQLATGMKHTGQVRSTQPSSRPDTHPAGQQRTSDTGLGSPELMTAAALDSVIMRFLQQSPGPGLASLPRLFLIYEALGQVPSTLLQRAAANAMQSGLDNMFGVISSTDDGDRQARQHHISSSSSIRGPPDAGRRAWIPAQSSGVDPATEPLSPGFTVTLAERAGSCGAGDAALWRAIGRAMALHSYVLPADALVSILKAGVRAGSREPGLVDALAHRLVSEGISGGGDAASSGASSLASMQPQSLVAVLHSLAAVRLAAPGLVKAVAGEITQRLAPSVSCSHLSRHACSMHAALSLHVLESMSLPNSPESHCRRPLHRVAHLPAFFPDQALPRLRFCSCLAVGSP